jgi:hypothetical protein
VIAECAASLLALVKTVPALADKTSLSIGGRSADPGLVKIPLPAAWITFGKEESDQASYERGDPSGMVMEAQLMMATFPITIFIPYVDDADLIDTQFPLLSAVIAAVHNQLSPSGFAWRFTGQRIALVYPDRLAYEQRYTLNRTLPIPV